MLQDFRNIVNPPDYYLHEARAAKEAGDYGYARRLLQRGTDLHPGHARLWQEPAKSLRSNREWDDETLRCFAKAYQLAPHSRHISMEYAGFLDRKNQYNRAEEIYMCILAGEGENARLLCALGNHFQLQKKYPLALACFARAVAQEPPGDIGQRRYAEVVGLAGRECNDDDEKKLTFRIIRMTGDFRPAKTAEVRPAAEHGHLVPGVPA